ncbi:MAG: hypothetical protein NTZ04_00995 [Chloroflexi bacterium]|nr:hypothetical protein [Chloroflexota bacterium]
MGVNLLEEIDRLATSENRMYGFRVAFFLTYTLNLQFFERLVLPKLRRVGVSHIGILADRRAYQASMSDPWQLEQCGRSYVLGYSPSLRTLQHGKLLWLHGDRDLVFCGSHNLTRSGFNDQLETTAWLDSGYPDQVPALKTAHSAVSALVRGSEQLSHIWSLVPEPIGASTQQSVHFLWSGHESLLHQLSLIVGDAHYIRVVTPFLDASALGELAASLSAKEVMLDLPFDGADTPLKDALEAVPGLTPRTLVEPSRLHGKAYEFESKDLRWLAIGSANCTRSGLVKGVSEGGNSEFLIAFPTGPLQDDQVEFRLVEDAAKFPGTGRRWDEADMTQSSGVAYLSATYENQVLSVAWECDGRLVTPRVIVGENEFELGESPSKVVLEHEPPHIVVLTGDLGDKKVFAKAWVVFPEELALHASGINVARRRSYIESRDPVQQALGIEFEIFQLVRMLRMPVTESGEATASPGRKLKKEEVDEAIGIFEFSPNPEEIVRRATSLILGDHLTDPIATIRGLIARITGPPPTDRESDVETVLEHASRQERAIRRISDRLIYHLRYLAGIDRHEWDVIPRERIEPCLQVTFEVAVLLWWKIVRREREDSEQFTQAMLYLLKALADSRYGIDICKQAAIAGPLMLAIGASAEGTIGDHEQKLLRRYMGRLIPANYRQIAGQWLGVSPIRAAMVLRVEGEGDVSTALEARLRPVYRLMGLADEQLLRRQDYKWGVLLKLIEAKTLRDPSAESLLKEAESRFKGHPVWQKCVEYLQTERIPPMLRVASPTCGKCFTALPKGPERELKRGEAVVCPNCGVILMFGKMPETPPN